MHCKCLACGCEYAEPPVGGACRNMLPCKDGDGNDITKPCLAQAFAYPPDVSPVAESPAPEAKDSKDESVVQSKRK